MQIKYRDAAQGNAKYQIKLFDPNDYKKMDLQTVKYVTQSGRRF